MSEKNKAEKDKRKGKLGEFLAVLREAKGVSVREVADATGISDPYLYQIENGKKLLTDPDFFKRIAGYFEIPVEMLLEKAGYLFQEETEEQKIEKAFRHVTSDPQFQFGARLKGKYDEDAKRFIIEMYEKLTGRKIIN